MMKRDKLKESNDITLPDTQVIQNVKEWEYKYLGVLEADQIRSYVSWASCVNWESTDKRIVYARNTEST